MRKLNLKVTNILISHFFYYPHSIVLSLSLSDSLFSLFSFSAQLLNLPSAPEYVRIREGECGDARNQYSQAPQSHIFFSLSLCSLALSSLSVTLIPLPSLSSTLSSLFSCTQVLMYLVLSHVLIVIVVVVILSLLVV